MVLSIKNPKEQKKRDLTERGCGAVIRGDSLESIGRRARFLQFGLHRNVRLTAKNKHGQLLNRLLPAVTKILSVKKYNTFKKVLLEYGDREMTI